jgi:hypothetical protein
MISWVFVSPIAPAAEARREAVGRVNVNRSSGSEKSETRSAKRARDVPCFKGRAVAEPYVVVLSDARVDNSNVRTPKALHEPLGRDEVLAPVRVFKEGGLGHRVKYAFA